MLITNNKFKNFEDVILKLDINIFSNLKIYS